MFHPTRLHSSFLFSKSIHSCRKKKFISGTIFLSQAVGFSYCRVCLFVVVLFCFFLLSDQSLHSVWRWGKSGARISEGAFGLFLKTRWKKKAAILSCWSCFPFHRMLYFVWIFFLFNYQHILTCEESDGPPSAAAGPKTNVNATRVAACSLTFFI